MQCLLIESWLSNQWSITEFDFLITQKVNQSIIPLIDTNMLYYHKHFCIFLHPVGWQCKKGTISLQLSFNNPHLTLFDQIIV